ncbi:hypothetical protein AFLA_007602 [Aspergillus flavus NRRL3357]|nr:hypothetical protein AFLA_007602 [Aspergillus flavus NRRL3357]
MRGSSRQPKILLVTDTFLPMGVWPFKISINGSWLGYSFPADICACRCRLLLPYRERIRRDFQEFIEHQPYLNWSIGPSARANRHFFSSLYAELHATIHMDATSSWEPSSLRLHLLP